MRTLLIDTDTASDDAVALVMAARHRDVRIEAVTVVSGNVPTDLGVTNALLSLEFAGADEAIPVYRGAERPLLREPFYAHWFHGRDGMGDQNYPPPRRKPAAGHAVDAIIDAVRRNPGIELVTLGPLTNVALAVARDPGLVDNVSRCVVMGGAACTVGNVTPAAEFNVWVDPEAARMVFHSGLPVEMVGWELALGEAALDDQDVRRVLEIGTPLARFAIDCNRCAAEACERQTRKKGLALCDPVAMAIALDPTVCVERSRHFADVETVSDLTRGMTVVDRLNVTGDAPNEAAWAPLTARRQARGPNVTVCWRIDAPRWKGMLLDLVRD
jgi:purine nucleosidase